MTEGKKINWGIELLRIVCMLMIILLHILYKGEILYSDTLAPMILNQAWILEALCYGAVNCYVMISGWLLAQSDRVKRSRVIRLWGQTLFYSVIIGLICVIVFDNVSGMDIVRTFMPVSSNSYWFITNYIILYLLHPVLNKAVQALEQRKFRDLLILLVLIFCVWPNIMPFFDTVDTSNGYSLPWFIILYLTGVYFRLYTPKWVKVKKCFPAYVIIALSTYLARMVCIVMQDRISIVGYYTDSFYAYNSIPVYIASIFLFLSFATVTLNITQGKAAAKAVLFFSTATLDVYLIHEQVILRQGLWTSIIPIGVILDSKWILLNAIFIALSVFVVCVIIARIRVCLVGMISRIKGKRTE